MRRNPMGLSMVAGVSLAVAGASAAPLEAVVSSSGKVTLRAGRDEVAVIQPGLFESGWRWGSFGAADDPGDGSVLKGLIRASKGGPVDTECRAESVDGGVRLVYTLTPRAPITVNSYHVSMDLPAEQMAGRRYAVDAQQGTIPENRGQTHVYAGPAQTVTLATADGGTIDLRLAEATPVLLQDNRQWGPSVSVRIGGQYVPPRTLPAGTPTVIDLTLSCPGGIDLRIDRPVTITAGEEWVPLDSELEIEAGSVLDFSSMGFLDAPAGKHGRLVSRPNGTFAFEDSPETPRRFYGVNFCFSAQYLEKKEADRLADRIARMGYNAIRVHHYEGLLVRSTAGSGPRVTDIPLRRAPTRTEEIDRLQTGEYGDHYGQRLRGFLHPPETGEYVFRIASDDASELWIDTGAGAGKQLLASVSGWTGAREFDKYPTQGSAPIALTAGAAYAIEVLHKEGAGGDHLAVAWEGPGGTTGIITGDYLSTPEGRRGAVLREIWESDKPDRAKDSTRLIPERLDQLDYFLAAFRKRGIYITTDLFVSRPVYADEIYEGSEGDFGMDEFKMAVPVNQRALDNWKAFSRNLLTHRNPYTGLTYAQDPALAWISMINEGNPGNHLGKLNGPLRADWTREWNAWLKDRYESGQALAKAWGRDPEGDPEQGTVPLFTRIHEESGPGRDLAAFCAFLEARMFGKMKTFLRDELGCKALLTNMNGWTNRTATHAARMEYDYIDDHFYVDHPRFLANRWQLPSSCPNTSPIRAGAPGGRRNAFVRQFGKPFTISEYNYSGPGRFRGVGGILTGCLGALQGWDVIWRFAYSHNRKALFQASPAGYFDVVSDPLNQVAERAAICLYLRGDLREAPHSVAIAVDPNGARDGKLPNLSPAPEWSEMAWITKVGTTLAAAPEDALGDIVLPLDATAWPPKGMSKANSDTTRAKAGEEIISSMRDKQWLPGNAAADWPRVLRSETGEIVIDAPRDVLILDTPRTAGGYAPAGETIETDAVTVRVEETDATVWVSSMDGAPIAASRRMILCHLTDLQNTGARFGEQARKTLYAWGRLPHLVRSGSATVRIRTRTPGRAVVYALSIGGRRLHRLPVEREGNEWVVRPVIRGPGGKARLVYEITIQ